MQTDDILYYSHHLNPRVAVAVARYLQAPVRLVRVEPMGRDQATFRAINPNTRVPVLVEPALTLWETDAIAMRLSGRFAPEFWPQARREEVMQWVSWSAHHFTHWAGVRYFERIVVPRYFTRAPDEAAIAAADAEFQPFAAVLDGILAGRRWLVGVRRPTPTSGWPRRCRSRRRPASRSRRSRTCARGTRGWSRSRPGAIPSPDWTDASFQGCAQASISPCSNGPIFCLSRRPSADTRIE